MKTPIADFIEQYSQKEIARLHMPGHKGKVFLGPEPYDITEIKGADELYHASGIIAESEGNASCLFSTAHSFYSAEGSTLAIKAMLALACTRSKEQRPLILAARNAHKAFLYAAAWLDFEIKWLYPEDKTHLCACPITKEAVAEAIAASPKKPAAVYLTSPDYLGNLADIAGIAKVLEKEKIPLLVDNAHGAYLAFCDPSRHPIALGATMCCDSAHKTLPVLTGGAYLHIAKGADPYFQENARQMLAAFASTSPSYLILASLDLANRYLAEGYREKLTSCTERVNALKARLTELGFAPEGSEPLKVVVRGASYGISGDTLADLLREESCEGEFSDSEYLVLMFTPENEEEDYRRVERAFEKAASLPRQKKKESALMLSPLPVAMTPREALLSPACLLPVAEAEGKISAAPTVSCPPAIPIAVSGEIITKDAIALFQHYGITHVSVVKETQT